MLVEHLFPVGEVLTQEYVLELLEGLLIIHVKLLRSTDEVVNRFIERKLDAKLARILMDFGLLFVARRVAKRHPEVSFRSRFSGP